jgi:hypothetical protein
MLENRHTPKGRAGKLVVGLVAALAATFASGLAFAGGGGGVYIPELGITVPAEKVAAIQHSLPRSAPESTERAAAPAGKPDRIPAEVLGPDVPVPISPEILRTTNGWLVSDGATLVAVYAGAAGDDPTEGRLVIVRQNLVAGVQTLDVVNAGKTGALAIADAPRGAAVETSAQRGGIPFRGAHGATGTLHLATDKVEVH